MAIAGTRVELRYLAPVLTLGLAAAAWAVTVPQMGGMNMGVATQLGSFGCFRRSVGADDGRDDAAGRRSGNPQASRGERERRAPVRRLVPGGLGARGCRVYALYRPHGPVAAGLAVIAAGVYELTPLKLRCRRRCRESVRSGLVFGLRCVGSSIGLMLILVALSLMSIAWMAVIAVLALAQKLLRRRPPSTCRWRSRSSRSGS